MLVGRLLAADAAALRASASTACSRCGAGVVPARGTPRAHGLQLVGDPADMRQPYGSGLGWRPTALGGLTRGNLGAVTGLLGDTQLGGDVGRGSRVRRVVPPGRPSSLATGKADPRRVSERRGQRLGALTRQPPDHHGTGAELVPERAVRRPAGAAGGGHGDDYPPRLSPPHQLGARGAECRGQGALPAVDDDLGETLPAQTRDRLAELAVLFLDDRGAVGWAAARGLAQLGVGVGAPVAPVGAILLAGRGLAKAICAGGGVDRGRVPARLVVEPRAVRLGRWTKPGATRTRVRPAGRSGRCPAEWC